MADAAGRLVPILDVDPELGAGLAAEDAVQARRLLVLPRVDLAPGGEWQVGDVAEEPTLGLLLLDGLVTVNVVIGSRVASHLMGPGDVLHSPLAADELVPVRISHLVSEAASVAVLDRRFIAATRRWPALLLALNERQRLQERRLAVNAAISKLRHVEERVLALLWHLAEQWGRVSAAGITLPLDLTHGALGELVGAERPTVSLALKALTERGELRRREDGAFVLPARSAALHALASGDRSAHGRPLAAARLPAEPVAAPTAPARPVGSVDVIALQRRIAVLHEELPERSRETDELLRRARAVSERSAARRAAR